MSLPRSPCLFEGLFRRLLFCFFFTSPGPYAHDLALNRQLHFEYFLVIGPCFSNGCVMRQCVMLFLTPLLKLSLVIPRSRLVLPRGNVCEFLFKYVAGHLSLIHISEPTRLLSISYAV